MKILFLLGITRSASQQRMPLNHTALLYIILYVACFFFVSAAELFHEVLPVCTTGSKYTRLRNMGGNIFMLAMMTSTHVYKTNKITRLGFRVGGGRDGE